MGFTALRRIARTLHWNFEADPSPDGDLQLTFDDFSYAVQLVRETGFPVERTNEEAWLHFRGWRVNYESLAYRLADVVVAPRAPRPVVRRPASSSSPAHASSPASASRARRQGLLRPETSA
jgi:hypothetical protein